MPNVGALWMYGECVQWVVFVHGMMSKQQRQGYTMHGHFLWKLCCEIEHLCCCWQVKKKRSTSIVLPEREAGPALYLSLSAHFLVLSAHVQEI
jgi:hypothetical protein